MATSRSYYLNNSRHDDFAEAEPGAGGVDIIDIPYVMPANDNLRSKDRLSARCGILPRRLIALHNLSWPKVDR
jgi:hypothetical protein